MAKDKKEFRKSNVPLKDANQNTMTFDFATKYTVFNN